MLTDYEIALLFRSLLALFALPRATWEQEAPLRQELQAAADRRGVKKSDGGAV